MESVLSPTLKLDKSDKIALRKLVILQNNCKVLPQGWVETTPNKADASKLLTKLRRARRNVLSYNLALKRLIEKIESNTETYDA